MSPGQLAAARTRPRSDDFLEIRNIRVTACQNRIIVLRNHFSVDIKDHKLPYSAVKQEHPGRKRFFCNMSGGISVLLYGVSCSMELMKWTMIVSGG